MRTNYYEDRNQYTENHRTYADRSEKYDLLEQEYLNGVQDVFHKEFLVRQSELAGEGSTLAELGTLSIHSPPFEFT